MKARLPLLSALVALSHAASAVVVNIDFNTATSATFSGQAAATDTAGNNTWNGVQSAAGTVEAFNLTGSGNEATTIDISIVGVDSVVSNAPRDQELAGGYLSLMRDYLRIDSGGSTQAKTTTGLISGLVPSASYEIFFYGQGEYFFNTSGSPTLRGQNSQFTVGSTSKQTGWDGVVGGNGTLADGVEYVKFTVSADVSGNIAFSWANVVSSGVNANAASDADGVGNSRYAALNAIQIRSVPEPAAALLGGLGLLGILVRRRR